MSKTLWCSQVVNSSNFNTAFLHCYQVVHMRVHIIAYGTLGCVVDLGRKRLDHKSWQKQLYIHNAINPSSLSIIPSWVEFSKPQFSSLLLLRGPHINFYFVFSLIKITKTFCYFAFATFSSKEPKNRENPQVMSWRKPKLNKFPREFTEVQKNYWDYELN